MALLGLPKNDRILESISKPNNLQAGFISYVCFKKMLLPAAGSSMEFAFLQAHEHMNFATEYCVKY